jgi:AAA15 family ATPase/GTPase
MKLTKLKVKQFRGLQDIELLIGDRLTAIAGQNGTHKTTLLGLLGHVCRDYGKNKTLNGFSFETEFSEIFKFSAQEVSGEHIYSVLLSKSNIETGLTDDVRVDVVSNIRSDTATLRLRTKKLEDKNRLEKKANVPVMLLGLKRLFPLAQEKTIKTHQNVLTNDEINFYQKAHNKILLMVDNEIVPKSIETSKKSFYAATTDKYDHLGNSAGQDNIGQILTSILSFRRLKEKLDDHYLGGLLLIDEIDATLFPAALDNLIDFLIQQSDELNLQIVFTTHSLEVLENINRFKSDAFVINFLHDSRGKIVSAEKPELGKIIANLKAKVAIDTIKKIHLYREDDEAELFYNYLVSKENKKSITVIKVSLGAENLVHLGKNLKIPEFQNSIILLDGDQIKNKGKLPSNVILLPGNESPENLLLNFLSKLPGSDNFWSSELGGYTKQAFENAKPTKTDRETMKSWFKAQIKFWGVDGKNLFKKWMETNPKEVETFNANLAKILAR